ncbi:dihydroorotate dehydrogenase (fumarate) [Kwoniella shandongensis]|uniref:Dihydroorotate dehydrogenase (quinone), mitochondrial n=1 Tax=Kwoniella shandongensis TaxID=1734106 RepID=A0A5M6C3B7_9TREE|nr:dihydroorotate dehydrogenase (fumarate) [Kwoniella shandongensis]KAA5528362.1 dihydroorotate dehydrogenase (fumarate) [Kwoniella shandongensis]
MSRLPFASLRRPLPFSAQLLRAPASVSRSVPALRYASTTSSTSPPRRYLSTTLLLGSGVLLLAYYYDSRSLLHEHVVMPLVRFALDPEEGHKLAVRVLGWDKWARPRDMGVDGQELQAELFGHKLNNPVGIAAGFDKDADAIDGLFDLGFGYVEIGSVTPEPQPGNPKPRFFRLEEDDAAINRYGFNSLGHGHALGRLRARLVAFSQAHPSLFPSPLPPNPLPPSGLPRSLRPGQLLAVNLGKNKSSAADSNDDYIRGVRTLGPYADVVVINVSSPNTPGLRALQGRQVLERLLTEVVEERDRIAAGTGLPKIAVKVASDLSEDELADVASAVRSSGVEGVIVSNTTVRRKELGLTSDNQDQVGGLSGKPLFPYALQALKTLRPLLPPSIPLIGCGGISTGSDALAMAQAGASIVQVYTTFGFRGVGTPRLIKDEITQSLVGSSSNWRSEIGKDWSSTGLTMGWDENRLKQESEAVKKEAEGLGELLRHLTEKEDVARLVQEAEKALGQAKASTSSKESEKEPQQEKGAESASRDNAIGAVDAPEQVGDVARGLVEAAPSSQPTEGTLIEHTTSEHENETPGVGVGAPSIGEAMASEPVAIDLGPVVVIDVEAETAGESENEWARSVHSGQRRLV